MAQDAFLTDPNNPEYADISRQRKLAEMLTLKAFEQPQGNMVSGRYVAPSWTQQLAPLVSGIAGQAMGKQLDEKQLKLAEALRVKKAEEMGTFQELMSSPETRNQAMQFAAKSQTLQPLVAELMKPQKLGEGEKLTMPSLGGGAPIELAAGGSKYRAPIQIDTGTSIEIRDPLDPTKVLQRIPKAQMPTAGQVVETANGPMLINTRTGAAQPIMGASGQPLAPKLSAEQSKDITAINQQISTIDGALQAVKDNPKAFSFKRGSAQDFPAGETIAGRFDKPEEAAARAYVFNNVSAVIKERAGTAQSAGELQRLNTFMPGPKDNAQQIENKFIGFKTYLKDLEKGTRVNPNASMQTEMPQALRATQTPQTPQFDPKLLQYMTPEQQALFAKPGK
jgi:hypothetical protein